MKYKTPKERLGKLYFELSKKDRWKMDRCGNITASRISAIMTGGRRKMTAEEKEFQNAKIKAGLISKNQVRTTVDIPFGDVAKDYLRSVLYERRTGKPLKEIHARSLEWGSEHELDAIEWYQNNYFENIQSCSEDFDDIVCKSPFKGFSDSPDFYLYENDNLSLIGEVKCNISESKFEGIREMSREEAKIEHRWQFSGHFIAHPKVNDLVYICYDGVDQEDITDIREIDSPDRGIVFRYKRKDFSKDIAAAKRRIKFCDKFVNMVLFGVCKPSGEPWRIKDINEYAQSCNIRI